MIQDKIKNRSNTENYLTIQGTELTRFGKQTKTSHRTFYSMLFIALQLEIGSTTEEWDQNSGEVSLRRSGGEESDITRDYIIKTVHYLN